MTEEHRRARAYQGWRSARRAVARQHHPDVGGDPDVYLARMREVDQKFVLATQNRVVADDPRVGPSAGRRQRLGRVARRVNRRARRRLRTVRGLLPRRFPGSRRYFDL